jgi:hypothetical protein
MQDLKDTNASRIFTAHPTAFNIDGNTTDATFKNDLLHALGCFTGANPPKTSKCEKEYTPSHAHCCVVDRRKAVTSRHDILINVLSNVCREAQCHTIEPTSSRPKDQPRIRPDLRIDMQDTSGQTQVKVSLDTTMVHTTVVQGAFHRAEVQESSKNETSKIRSQRNSRRP